MPLNVSSYIGGGGSWLTHLDLPKPYQHLCIAKVEEKLVGKSAESKICVTFDERPGRPLPLNLTNLRVLALLFGNDAEQWIGQKVAVYRSITEFNGEPKLCLRLCDPGKQPPDRLYDKGGKPAATPTPAPWDQQSPSTNQ